MTNVFYIFDKVDARHKPFSVASRGDRLMGLDYKLAFSYPFKAKNRLNCLLIPAIITFIYTGLTALLDQGVLSLDHFLSGPWAMIFMKENVRFLILQGFFAFLSGYNWHLSKLFQEKGYDEPAPSWGGMFKTYWFDGFKLFLFFVVLFIPLYAYNYMSIGFLKAPTRSFAFVILGAALILAMTYFLISPFLGTSYVISAPTRKLRDLFNFAKSCPITLRSYGKMLMAKFIFYLLVFGSLVSLFIVSLLPVALFPATLKFILNFFICYINSSILMTIFSHLMTQIILPKASDDKELAVKTV